MRVLPVVSALYGPVAPTQQRLRPFVCYPREVLLWRTFCSVQVSPTRTFSPRRVLAVLPVVSRTTSTMARKRKSHATGPTLEHTPTTPTNPIDDRRRSSRRISTTLNRGNANNTKQPLKGVGIMPLVNSLDSDASSSLSDMPESELEQAKDEARVGVNHAIKGLARMERHLMRATKRQKLQVEESASMVAVIDPEPLPISKPKGKPPVRQAGRAQGKRLPTPDRDTLDSPYEDEDECVHDDEDIADIVPAGERGAARPPPINSDYLPLPWKGRLGYACLNTYLRSSKPPVFSSRTCRMASIIDHRYPLQDPSQPEHPLKNRPDKTKKADYALGQKFVQDLGLANARDITKMLRWNDKYGIKFMRLSSEMFPFASHQEHGYKLAGFAAGVLAEAGLVAAQLGHRLTTHPGQFTQLGSPRKEVVTAAIRDLDYHDELLTLLQLPPQQDRDAVMILHMGGVFGDKAATLDRFRQNYTTKLSDSVKRRLVLENDDVGWSVHDLLPICEELNIPMVLDWHHHNIVFDSTAGMREGTLDISDPALQTRITDTWRRKGITQKMHYSESCPGAVTPRDRRKHRPRVATLPPCAADVDLMIEAKDKEQAVFELMKTFRLPGHDRINDMIPYDREDECKPVVKKKIKATKKQKKNSAENADGIKATESENGYEIIDPGREVPEEDVGMGGPLGRVYWHPGMEEWLRPKKRELVGKKKSGMLKEEEE